MAKVFIDTSILLASLRSPHGGSSALLRYAVVGTIDAYVSDDVIDEVSRHIHEVDAALRANLLTFLASIPFTLVQVSSADVQQATLFTDPKDSPIVAAAKKAAVDYLVTLDKRHLLNRRSEIEPNVSFTIVRPEDVLALIRMGEKDDAARGR